MSTINHCDYFISYNAADRPHAEAINGSLRNAGFTTHFAGTDVPDGGNIPAWMDRALGASTQVLALCSPDYFKSEAVFSEVERAATFWADPDGARARLVPVEIAPCTYSPLYAPLKRIEISGMTPDAAAEALLAHLRQTEEIGRRKALRHAAATPEIFSVPRARPTHFFGREQALAELQTILGEGRNAAITQAIAGMGGIGKTTLAIEYAHRFGTRGRYAGVWWIPAESESGIVQSLGDLALRLGHPESQDLPAMARWARDKVGQSTQPWLLVFDNLTSPDTLTHRRPTGERESWLPPGTARVLITSRWDDFTGVAETTRLDQWSLATTADYLLSVTGRADREGAEALARVLDGLPLAANQAAAFLRGRPGISFATYAAEIGRLVARERYAGHTGDYPETVYATLTKSLAALPEASVDLLCLLSWLSPDGTEEVFLEATAKINPEFLSEALAGAFADPFDREDAIKPATDLSLLGRDADPRWGGLLLLHRMTALVLRLWQTRTARSGWDIRAAQIINALFPFVEVYTWELCARLLPHARVLADHGSKGGEGAKPLGRLLNQAGLYLANVRGDAKGAMELLEPAVTLAREENGEDSAEFSTRLNNLAGRYTDIGRLDEAEAAYRRVIEIEEKILPEDPTLAVSYNNLAKVHWKREEFAEAAPLLQRAREIVNSAHGELSLEHASVTNSLGSLYDNWAKQPGERHRRAEARHLNEEANRIARTVLGERHPRVSGYLHNLAVLEAREDRFGTAADLALRASAIMLSLGTLEHPLTQQRLQDLGYFWDRSGQQNRTARLEAGDPSDFLPEIAEVERLMNDWVAEDPETRHFGPPPFAEHHGKL